MKRQLMSAALGLMMAFSAIGPVAAEEVDRGVALYGCVVVGEDGTLVVTTGGAGRGPNAGTRGGHETYHVQIPEGSELEGAVQNGCGMVVVYQQNGVWYARSVQVTADGSGAVEYESTSVSGDGHGDVTIEEENGSFERPAGPRGNR